MLVYLATFLYNEIPDRFFSPEVRKIILISSNKDDFQTARRFSESHYIEMGFSSVKIIEKIQKLADLFEDIVELRVAIGYRAIFGYPLYSQTISSCTNCFYGARSAEFSNNFVERVEYVSTPKACWNQFDGIIANRDFINPFPKQDTFEKRYLFFVIKLNSVCIDSSACSNLIGDDRGNVGNIHNFSWVTLTLENKIAYPIKKASCPKRYF